MNNYSEFIPSEMPADQRLCQSIMSISRSLTPNYPVFLSRFRATGKIAVTQSASNSPQEQ